MESMIYPVSLSSIFASREGISILRRVTSFFIASRSHGRTISKTTFDPAGQRIFRTASLTVIFLSSTPFAFVMISPASIPASLAGDPAMILSTDTPKSFFTTTAQIPSKFPLRASLNFFVSSWSKNSLCLSHKDSTNPRIIP